MTTLREAAQMALDVLDDINQCSLPPTGIPLPAEIDEAMDSLRAALAQPPCATGAQCVGGKCERCAVQEPWGYISHRSWKMPVFVEAENLEVSGLPFNNPNYTPVYKAPPQRKWIGLTSEERLALWSGLECDLECLKPAQYAEAIEAKLREKNFDRPS